MAYGLVREFDAEFKRALAEERKSITWKAVGLQAGHELANVAVTRAEEDEGKPAVALDSAETAKSGAIRRRDELLLLAASAATHRDQHQAHGQSVHLN
jgi:hypothetical protein